MLAHAQYPYKGYPYLDHKGPGSPFALLQDCRLCHLLSAGLLLNDPEQALFQIDVGLTEKGETEWEEVEIEEFGRGE